MTERRSGARRKISSPRAASVSASSLDRLDEAAPELDAALDRREPDEPGPPPAVRREELALAAPPGRGRGRQKAAARQIALDHDELAALAADRVGPHQPGRVVVRRPPARREQRVEIRHAIITQPATGAGSSAHAPSDATAASGRSCRSGRRPRRRTRATRLSSSE